MAACRNLRVTINYPMLAKSAALSSGKSVWMMRNATVTTCTLNLNVVDALILRSVGLEKLLGSQGALSCGSPTVNTVSLIL